MAKFCQNCGSELPKDADVCISCGKEVNKENNNKKSNKAVIIVVIVVALLVIGGVSSLSKETNLSDNSDNTNEASNENINENTDSSANESVIIYQDDDFLVEITNWEYKSISDRIVLSVYIENNSDTDTNFLIDDGISIDGYMVDGGYFYKTVNANTKTNEEVSVYGLKDNDIDGENAKEMKFKLDIYQSENYIITNRIVENQEIAYELN